MHRPLFIVFEGIDGSGTTTQSRLLVNFLRSECSADVVHTREPGGTPLAERIRALVLDPNAEEMDFRTELLLYAAGRAQHVREIIIPALRKGTPIICDRFVDSTVAYQGYGRELDRAIIQQLNEIASMGCNPDATVYLDVTVDEAFRRRSGRNEAADRMENAGHQFQKRVLEGYRAQANNPKTLLIDAMKSAEEVASDIRARLFSRWPGFPYDRHEVEVRDEA